METAEMEATNLDFKNTGDSLSDAKMQAVQALHQQKVKILMKSVNALKEEIAALKAQNKDHRQARLVQAMRGKVREAELVADVLKGELCRTSSLSLEEVNELIMKKTLGGPKRFRPKIREELQNELSSLERQYKRAMDKLKANARPPLPLPPTHHTQAENRPPLMPNTPMAAQPSPGGAGPCTVDVQAVGELLEQVEALRVAVRSRDVTLNRYMEEVERARQDAREYRMVSDRLAARERKLESVSERLGQVEGLYQAALSAQDTAHEELATHKAMTQLAIDEGRLENEALKQQCLEHMAQARELLQREGEVVGELERCRQVWAQEKAALTREAKHRDAALDDTRKALASERSQRGKLEESVVALELRLKGLEGAEGEVAAVREKLREANLGRTEAEKKWREGKERYDALHKSASEREAEARKRYEEAVESLSRDHSEQVLIRDQSLQSLQQQQDAARRELEEAKAAHANELALAHSASTQALNAKQHTLDTLTTHMAALEASLHETKAAGEALRREFVLLKESHDVELSRLRQEHEHTHAQAAAHHQRQVEGASAELSSWRASSEKTVMELQEAQAALTQQLTQAQAQLHDAQAALTDARKAHLEEKVLWEGRLEEAKGAIRALQLDPPTSPKAAQAMQALSDDKQSLQVEKIKLEHDKLTLEEAKGVLEQDKRRLEDEKKRLEDDKTRLEDDKAALLTKLQDAQKQIEEAKMRDEQLKAMQDKVRVLEEQAAQALGRADTLAAQVSSLEASSGEEGASLRGQMTQLRAQLEASSVALANAEANLKERDARLKAFHNEGQAIIEEAKHQAALTLANEEKARKSLVESKDESDRLDAHVAYLEALLSAHKVVFLARPINAIEASARRATVISGMPLVPPSPRPQSSTPEPHIDFPRAMSPRSDDTFRLSDDSSHDTDSTPNSPAASTGAPHSPPLLDEPIPIQPTPRISTATTGTSQDPTPRISTDTSLLPPSIRGSVAE